tara:strand:- start:12501 stop:13325 length:825 start_codon:yes stop_codon:yes gene_type:complete
MINNKIYISIITLTKNDICKFKRTLESIKSQKTKFYLEWLIIDGSKKKEQLYIINLVRKNFKNKNNILINHINMKKHNISGIYPSMNFGKEKAKGTFINFLNSGDIFFNCNSLDIILKNSIYLSNKNTLIFGQASIIAQDKITWNFPGNSLKNVDKWLEFFEPNHQSMIITKELATKYDFPLNQSIIGDGTWKRKIINDAYDILYIKTPLVKFYLDGVSSKKPSKKILNDILINKKISFLRKLIFVFKYFFPKDLFYIYHLMQKYKSIIIDLII